MAEKQLQSLSEDISGVSVGEDQIDVTFNFKLNDPKTGKIFKLKSANPAKNG